MKKYKLYKYFIIIFLGLSFPTFTLSEKSFIKVKATIIDKKIPLIKKIDKNLYEVTVENNYKQNIIIKSYSSIKSFPKKKFLKPGEKQHFKFITKDPETICLIYFFDNNKKIIKFYEDLYKETL